MTATTPAAARPLTPFLVIWTGQTVSLIGSGLAQFALVWWLTQSTGSATVLATATLVAVLPTVLLGPLAGALVDRWHRRRVMMVADGLVALASLWLAVLIWLGLLAVWQVYVLMFVRALGSAFHGTAMQASTSLMVPEEHLTRVAGLTQTTRGVLDIVAPPLGALLLVLLPLHGIMLLDVVTALFAIGPLFFISIPQPARPTGTADIAAGPSSLWSEVGAGLAYVWAWRGLLAIAVMAALINAVLGPAFSLTPLLVTRHFHGEAFQLGWLNAAWGGGIVLGGLLLGVWGGFRRRIATSLFGLTVMGAGILLVGLAPASAFLLAVAGMLIAGLMNPITNGPLLSLLQATVAPAMQGRVFTLVNSLATAVSVLSLAVAGPIADVIGIRAWYLVGGGLCILMGLGAFLVPTIVTLEQQAGAALEPEPAGRP